ncbi:MAG: O-methyltransferase [Acidimicrobiales bacterium]
MIVTPEIDRYAEEHTSPEPDMLAALAAETRAFSESHGMLVGSAEGRFLELLVWLSGARNVLEIGTFTGYSALAMAAALPPDGRIVTCEINEEHAAMARRHIEASPYAGQVEVRLGPALETVATLDGPFDLVFIDADKVNYSNYYEAVLPKLADRGLIVADNVLWSGAVLDPGNQTDDTVGIRAFNERVRHDPRVVSVMLTIRDGVTVIRRA